MASNHTEHYGLSQWAETDAFLREEFNGDHGRLEEALGWLAERGAEAGYHTCRLLLQHEYEGKHAGQRQGLLWDGFRTGDRVAERDDALVLAGGRVVLSGLGQSSVSFGYGVVFGASYSEKMTAAGSGYLTGFTAKIFHSGQSGAGKKLLCQVIVNGVTVHSEEVNLYFNAGETRETIVNYVRRVPVVQGDQVQYVLSNNNDSSVRAYCSSKSQSALGGTAHFTSAAGKAGSLTTAAEEMPACRGMRAWVRHSGGTVGLSVRTGEGGLYPMEAVGQQLSVNCGGGDCVEGAFRLDRALEAGPRALVLTMERGAAQTMEVYDYGAVMV